MVKVVTLCSGNGSSFCYVVTGRQHFLYVFSPPITAFEISRTIPQLTVVMLFYSSSDIGFSIMQRQTIFFFLFAAYGEIICTNHFSVQIKLNVCLLVNTV